MYQKTLAEWAGCEKEKAELTEDERMKSIHLMKASMFSDMLTVLGKTEISGVRTGVIESILKTCISKQESFLKVCDFDSADREREKAEAIKRAMRLMKEETV